MTRDEERSAIIFELPPQKQRPPKPDLRTRVVQAAEVALTDHGYVSPFDVLASVQFLFSGHVDIWRKGIIDVLESLMQGTPAKRATCIATLREWAQEKGLAAEETRYVRQTRNGPVDLQVTLSGDPELEKAYRTHFISPALAEPKRKRLQEKLEAAPRPVVFQVVRDSKCSECGAEIDEGSFLLMEANQPLCLPCARLAGLEFLPSGDTALTRRATKHSAQVAIVVRFSRSRKRYERQGILVEPAAIEQAERECTQDANQRAAARARAADQRRQDDRVLAARMAEEIRALFPGCPPGEAAAIAEHAAERGSGRVGRTAAGRKLAERALTLAVVAAVRHNHTNYDDLLAQGAERETARDRVADAVDETLRRWLRE